MGDTKKVENLKTTQIIKITGSNDYPQFENSIDQ